MATIELVKVCLVRDATQTQQKTISRPTDTLSVLSDIASSDREHFVVLHLNTRNSIIAKEIVSIGTLNSSLVHPREVLKAAILNNADKILIAHNHPSGDVTPSPEDRTLTKRMKQAGELMGIDVIDHLIVAGERYLSFKEEGLM
jgi:DNA repair protein RadC